MSKTAVIGTGVDFSLAGNGLISQWLTDVSDPNVTEIPSGNWNFEMYFSASSSGGVPKFYIEILKYDGATFTTIADNSLVPEPITSGTAIDLYLTSVAVPLTTMLTTDRIALRVYIVDSVLGRTIINHTQNSHLCQIITTFSSGVSSINGLTEQTQYLAVGTSGTDFAINSVTDTHTFNLPTASATNRGALSSANWSTFNGKQNQITLTTTGSGAATFIADTLNIPTASGGTPAGTTGQIQFNNAGAFGADSGLFWDNTNKRLGVGATPATNVRLDILGHGTLSTDLALRVRNTADTITILASNALGHIETRVNNSFHFKTSVIGSLNTVSKGDFGGYENGMVVGHSNTMNANVNMYIFGNNNSNSSNGNGIIAGYNNTNCNSNIFGNSNLNKAGNTFGNSNAGTSNVFGNNNSISVANGHGSSAFTIGNFLTLSNAVTINDTIFFGVRSTLGSPFISMHQNNLGIGGVLPNSTNYDLNARGVFYTQNGTAPTTLVADTFGLYSNDIVAGNAAPHFRTENGNIIKLYQETTAITAATLTSNLGTPLTSTDTIDGYTIQQMVKALRNLGILA
jgi:hypothetical protein